MLRRNWISRSIYENFLPSVNLGLILLFDIFVPAWTQDKIIFQLEFSIVKMAAIVVRSWSMKFLFSLFHEENIQHCHKTCIFICTDVFRNDSDDVYNAVTLDAVLAFFFPGHFYYNGKSLYNMNVQKLSIKYGTQPQTWIKFNYM